MQIYRLHQSNMQKKIFSENMQKYAVTYAKYATAIYCMYYIYMHPPLSSCWCLPVTLQLWQSVLADIRHSSESRSSTGMRWPGQHLSHPTWAGNRWSPVRTMTLPLDCCRAGSRTWSSAHPPAPCGSQNSERKAIRQGGPRISPCAGTWMSPGPAARSGWTPAVATGSSCGLVRTRLRRCSPFRTAVEDDRRPTNSDTEIFGQDFGRDVGRSLVSSRVQSTEYSRNIRANKTSLSCWVNRNTDACVGSVVCLVAADCSWLQLIAAHCSWWCGCGSLLQLSQPAAIGHAASRRICTGHFTTRLKLMVKSVFHGPPSPGGACRPCRRRRRGCGVADCSWL